jgi:hypothetical protein
VLGARSHLATLFPGERAVEGSVVVGIFRGTAVTATAVGRKESPSRIARAGMNSARRSNNDAGNTKLGFP